MLSGRFSLEATTINTQLTGERVSTPLDAISAALAVAGDDSLAELGSLHGAENHPVTWQALLNIWRLSHVSCYHVVNLAGKQVHRESGTSTCCKCPACRAKAEWMSPSPTPDAVVRV